MTHCGDRGQGHWLQGSVEIFVQTASLKNQQPSPILVPSERIESTAILKVRTKTKIDQKVVTYSCIH